MPEPRLPADSMTAGQGLRKLEERGRRGRLFYRPLADTCDGPAWGHIRTVDGGSASRPAPRTGPVAGAGIEPLHPATGVTETQAQPARPGRLPLARRSERALSTRGGCHTRSTEPLQKGRTEFLRTTAGMIRWRSNCRRVTARNCTEQPDQTQKMRKSAAHFVQIPLSQAHHERARTPASLRPLAERTL